MAAQPTATRVGKEGVGAVDCNESLISYPPSVDPCREGCVCFKQSHIVRQNELDEVEGN